MARWTDLAEWRGPTVNQGPAMAECRGLVIHIAEGSFEGTIAWCKNPSADVSAHFVVAMDGRIAQMVDTSVAAWTQRDGNGHWLSVENEGFSTGSLTLQQVEANAKLFARGRLEAGYPLQLATSPDGMGLGHHSMGAESGANWGHSQCPGTKIKAQKPAILARAIQIANGDTDMTPQQEYVQHVMNYRLEAVKAMRDPIVIPAFTATGGKVYPATTEPNLLAQAILAIPTTTLPVDVDEAAIAAEVAAQLDVPTAAEVADAVNDDAAARLAD